MVNDHCISNPKIIADSFNTYFVNIESNRSSKVNLRDHSLSFNNYLTSRRESRFNFSTISVEEVLSVINNLENKNSSGYDDISNKLLKSIKVEVCTPLTVILNQSLLNGIFPDALKIVIVKPLFKKGEKNSFNNYRPISLLPTIFSFRPQHYTELATIKLIDSIISHMDDKKNIKMLVALFLDLSKAFDTLDFDILLTKLQYYGICYNVLDLVKSYLLNRFQLVKYKNTQSNLI